MNHESQTRTMIIKIVCVAMLVFFLCGCGRVELYQDLTEEETNEILVLLAENNIKAGKKKITIQNEVSYTVDVREADMAKARSLLMQHNLPRRKELGLTGVYKDKGLIPTPDEQKARFLLALKGEIINSLERVPQIVDADVVLNVPTKDEFASADKQKMERPTASVVIRVKPDAPGVESITEAKIQQFVANTVEGMNPRDITVIISYITSEEKTARPGDVKSLGTELGPRQVQLDEKKYVSGAEVPSDELVGLKLDAESKGRLKVYLLVFFLILVILSLALIVVIIQGSRMRRTLSALSGPAGDHPAIEGQVIEEGPPKLGGGGSSGEL